MMPFRTPDDLQPPRALLVRAGWLVGLFIVLVWSPATCRAEVEAEAYIGEPFGVGRVTVDVMRGEPSLPLQDERFTLADAEGRVLYPMLKQEPVRRIIRRLLDISTPRRVTMYFLFCGDETLDVSAYSPTEQGVRVVPRNSNAGHQRLLDAWWKQTADRWQDLQKDREFPPVAENFVVATFARRLGRDLPRPRTGLFGLRMQEASALQELFGTESAVLEVDRQMLYQQATDDEPHEPLPEPPVWDAVSDVGNGGETEIEVEPIARHVPPECFYLRFGSFTNYQWFRDWSAKWHGNLQNMVLRRGIDRHARDRAQQQLSLKETSLSRVLGPQFIEDAALVGLDPYVAHGSAVGLLVKAKNNFVIAQDFTRQRREALTKFDDAEESTVDIGDHQVSLIATPHGQVRSYYAQSGDFHLVATSETLVRRFLEVGAGEPSLADSPSFRRARRQLPVDRDDTVFVFVSEHFFQNLCSPQYWIELRRRLRSVREPLLVDLAGYAAAAESRALNEEVELLETDLLPAGFGNRTDGSQLERGDVDAEPIDTLRGALGYFTSVADTPIDDVTSQEAADYRRFIERFQRDVGQLPSVAVGVQRVPLGDEGNQTLAFDVFATPMDAVKLGPIASSLGPPDNQRVSPVTGNVASFEAVLDVPVPLLGGERQPHHLFGGLRDYRSPLAVRGGTVVSDTDRTELVRGYLGAWPRPGILALLVGDFGTERGEVPVPAGPELWQAKKDDVLLISFKPDVLHNVVPELTIAESERPAQVRLHIDDLTDKQLAESVNVLGYKRSRETSVAASRLMNSLGNLLRVPRDECRRLAERSVDGEFVCPLAGEYQLFAPQRGLEVWYSTALPANNRFLLTEVPNDFQLDFLTWFRGLRIDLRLEGDELSAHGEVDVTSLAVP